MEKLYNELMDAFEELFEIHTSTKATDYTVHKATEPLYTGVLELAHKVAERMADKKEPILTEDCDVLAKRAYDATERVKTALEAAVKEKNSVGTDNLLRGLVDEAESLCGIAASIVEEEDEEDEKPEASANDKSKLLKKKY